MTLGVVGLVTAIGDENIRMQNLDTSAISLDWDHKKGTKITFGTDAVLGANGTELLGIVLWLPRDAVAKSLEAAKESAQ
jgi:hypothetical protein